MGREKSIRDAARLLDGEAGGSEILDRQMLRRIDEDVGRVIAGNPRTILPPLPKGYSWMANEGEQQGQSAQRVRAPDGSEISFDEISQHAFKTDRSTTGRYARIWGRGLEGLRDSTIRRHWGLSPENQNGLDKFFGNGLLTRPISAFANLAAYGADLLNVPAQTGAAAVSQYATELQDEQGLPSWKYGNSRPKDMWEAGSAAYEDWMEALPVMAAPLRGVVGRASPKLFLTKYDQDYAEALIATSSAKAAKILASPYRGDGHHGIITRAVEKRAKRDGKQWLVDISKSGWNKSDLSAESRLDFVKKHGRVHKNTVTSRMPGRLPSADPRDYGVKPYGPVGRFWYGIPLRTRSLIAVPSVIGSGVYLWDKVIDEPKVPTEGD